MAELLLRADGTTLAMAKRLSALVGSQQNYDTCKFEFDGEWDGFDKTVVFYTNPKFKTLAKLDENDVCAFPKDAVKGYGVLFIGVFGEKDDTVLPTNYVSHILVKGANAKTEIPEDDVFGAIEIYDSVDDLPEAAENGTLASVLFEDEDGERYAILYIYKQGWIVASAEPSDDLVFVDSISDLPSTGTLALVRTVSPLFDPYIFEVGQEFDKLYVNPNPIAPWEEANLDWEGGGLGVATGTALPVPQVIIELNDNQWAYICCPFNGVIKIDDEAWQANAPAGWIEVNFDPSTHTITGIPIDFSDIPEIEDVEIETVCGDIGYFISPNPYPQHNETAILYAYDNGWRSVENIENLYKLVIGNTNARHTHPNADILNSFYMVDGQIYLGGIASGIKIEEVDSVSELEELPAGTRQAIVKTASEEADGDLFVEGEIYDTVYVSEKAERPLMDASVQIGSALFRARAFNPSTWYFPVGWEIHDFRDGWDYWHLPDGYDDVESTHFPITEPIPQGWYKQEWAGQEVIPISYSDLPDFSEMGKCSLMTNPRELSKFISPTPFQPAFYYTLYTRNSEGEFVPVSDPQIKSLIGGLGDISEKVTEVDTRTKGITVTDGELFVDGASLSNEVSLNTASRHNHTNKTTLDGFSVVDGVLLFNGEPVGTLSNKQTLIADGSLTIDLSLGIHCFITVEDDAVITLESSDTTPFCLYFSNPDAYEVEIEDADYMQGNPPRILSENYQIVGDFISVPKIAGVIECVVCDGLVMNND